MAGPPGDARGDDRGGRVTERRTAARGGARGRRRLRAGRRADRAVGPGAGRRAVRTRRGGATSPPPRSRAARTSRAGPGSGAGPRCAVSLLVARDRSASPGPVERWSTGCPAGGGCRCRWPWRRSRSSPGSLTLPFAVALRRHVLDYGLSNQAWAAYAVDLVKSEALDMVVTSLVMLVLVGSARRWPRAWPAVAGAVLAVLVLLGSLVYPLLVEPLFNSFTPLAGRPAAHPDPRPRRAGGGGRRRRPGRGRVAAHDDAERVRLGVREHPPRGRLRQPGRGPRRGRDRLGRRARARPRQAPGRARGLDAGCRGCGARRRAAGPARAPAPGRRRTTGSRGPAERAPDPGPGRPGGAARRPDPERDQPAGSRPAPTWTRCGRPRTRRRSSRCSGSWRGGPPRT